MSEATSGITLSDSAAKRINEITAGEPINKVLRVSVEGGGCSGFQYKFDLAPGPQDDDIIIEHAGAVVLIDPTSLPLLAGSQIDFVDELIGSAFQIKNPNASSSCGCGTSFNI
ncbi:MAG: iron-sulfur cluster assembly accessory protein [Pseudomonadota bacterium]